MAEIRAAKTSSVSKAKWKKKWSKSRREHQSQRRQSIAVCTSSTRSISSRAIKTRERRPSSKLKTMPISILRCLSKITLSKLETVPRPQLRVVKNLRRVRCIRSTAQGRRRYLSRRGSKRNKSMKRPRFLWTSQLSIFIEASLQSTQNKTIKDKLQARSYSQFVTKRWSAKSTPKQSTSPQTSTELYTTSMATQSQEEPIKPCKQFLFMGTAVWSSEKKRKSKSSQVNSKTRFLRAQRKTWAIQN